MKIERCVFPTPPPEFKLTFTKQDGRSLVAALRYFAKEHPGAVEAPLWKEWAAELDKKLSE